MSWPVPYIRPVRFFRPMIFLFFFLSQSLRCDDEHDRSFICCSFPSYLPDWYMCLLLIIEHHRPLKKKQSDVFILIHRWDFFILPPSSPLFRIIFFNNQPVSLFKKIVVNLATSSSLPTIIFYLSSNPIYTFIQWQRLSIDKYSITVQRRVTLFFNIRWLLNTFAIAMLYKSSRHEQLLIKNKIWREKNLEFLIFISLLLEID